jgi:hypothetical protein
MPYLLLIVEPTGQRQERGLEAGQVVYQRMLDFAGDLQARGLLLGVNSLASTADAARVQVRAGRRSVTDGPFAEAKEMVGGYFLLDTDSRETALEIAAACPAAEWCSVEVRRVAPCFDDGAGAPGRSTQAT